MVKVGIIGGSGLENPDLLQNSEQKKMHTPYGMCSDLVTTGKVGGVDVVIIPRHGRNHHIYPSKVNARANVWAMKELGVTHILAPTACGSLREDIAPGHLVFIDQFIDRTTKRHQTFYEGQEVCHISMADPFCEKVRNLLVKEAANLGLKFHGKGTMVVIEGPRFSTRAESELFRKWGCDTINMTTVPEAVLAREAGICYQPIAMSTDYDCWRQGTEDVSVDMLLATMKLNADNVVKLVLKVVPLLSDWECGCRTAIESSLL